MANLTHYAAASLAGSWLNMILYMSQVYFSVWYLHYFNMIRLYRLGICFVMVADGVCSIVVMANVYILLIQQDGNPLPEQPWTLPVMILLTYLSSAMEQSFFVYRYWTISRNKWLTGFVGVLIVGHYLCAIASASYVFIDPIIASNSLGLSFTIALATICSGTDLLIASALAWKLSTIETPFTSTKSLLRRVALYAVSCGLTTATTTTTMVVLLFTDITGFTVVFSVLGRMYSLTILFNLMMVRANKQSYEATFSMTRGEAPTEPPVVLSPIFFNHDTTLDPSDALRKSFQGNNAAETHHVQYPPNPPASPDPTSNHFDVV